MQCLRIAAAIASLVMLASCGGLGRPQRPPTPLPNTIGFPLYPKASILSVHTFPKYQGRQVIASTNASFTQLVAWVRSLSARPPAGYHRASFENPQAWQESRDYGFEYAVFTRGSGNTKHDLLVVVMDPQKVNEQFGTVLGLMGKYRFLPGPLRKPIDDQVKARIGVTLSQVLEPDNPIGAALSALDQFERSNARGIVVLDSAKR